MFGAVILTLWRMGLYFQHKLRLKPTIIEYPRESKDSTFPKRKFLDFKGRNRLKRGWRKL